MSQHTQYAPNQERNWFLWGWLALVIVNNLFTLVSFFTGGNNPLAYIIPVGQNPIYSGTAIWIANIASAAAIVFCVALLLRYKIGYYGLVISYIVMTVAGLIIGFNIGLLLVLALVALITWVLIRPSWGQMK
ncbi:MAG TPA: hypothetical protein VHD90_23435 [Phototrophicaceae bacterium]|nr:hypothetical protein [Phototrophicaceae bacterium]